MPLHRRSLATGALLVGLAAALVAPTAAAGKTRWVDDDGKAGPTRCAGTTKAAKAVQPAIKASAAGDTVKVCPGTYTGGALIQGPRAGLKLLAATSTRPVLQLPRATEGDIVAIRGTDRVTVRGFTVRTNTADPCAGRVGVVVSDAQDVVLGKLRIEATGTATQSGCKLVIGVSLSDASATITNLRVIDPTSNAIEASASAIAVTNATADYLHASETGPGAGTMFKVENGTTGSLTQVTVNGLATAGTSTPRLSDGIRLQDAGDGFVVEGAVIAQARFGIRVAGSDTASIAGATIGRADTAVWVSSGTGFDITGVTATDVATGILVEDGTGGQVHGNDLTGATDLGCRDDTIGGTGTLGTQNTWTGNTTSTTSSPDGLCTEP